MRVIQLLPTLAYGDAVGNDVLALRDIISGWGYETGIWAENIGPLMEDMAQYFNTPPRLRQDDVIIYHGSIGSDLTDKLSAMPGRKVLIYHNITPPHFFHEFNGEVEANCQRGLDQMRGLAKDGVINYCIADSAFNKSDLLEMGFTCPVEVCPILIPFQDYSRQPSPDRLKELDDENVNVLFVGRGAPNKKQEDVIRAFHAYHTCFNPASRLILVGGWMEDCLSRAKDDILRLGLSNDILITDHVSFEELLACYQAADVFLCMSEHEGFCVPLVEAMYFNIPIVAYASSAVPDTLGSGGVLINKKEPLEAAWQIHRLVEDEDHWNHVVEEQRRRLKDFSYESVSATLEETLLRFIREGENSQPVQYSHVSASAPKRRARHMVRH